MKKGMLVLSILILIISIFCFLKEKKIKASETSSSNPYQTYNFYKEENYERYLKYQASNNLKIKDIVLQVNMGLDNSFYTNTQEVTTFDNLMLVNKYNYVSKNFKVPSLVAVTSFAKEGMYLAKDCKEAFLKMASKAKEEGYNLRAISTYRTYEYQENLYQNYAKEDGINKADTYSARPGFSEHHTGLAIDIDNLNTSYLNFEETKEFNWMQENANKYGFILRYPKEKEKITGYIYEPWHYRYVGETIATYIKNHNITYEEYYYEFLNK